jgi:excisionase family DNA binding protein
MKTATESPASYFDRKTTAAYLGVALSTVCSWAYRGDGPQMIRVGGRVRYRREDLDEWLKSRTSCEARRMTKRRPRKHRRAGK